MRSLIAAILLATTGLAACGNDIDEPSAACSEAMAGAAAEPDPGKADLLISATLQICSTAPEWLGGLADEPGAMGLTERATIDQGSVQTPCFAYPDTAVCRDARERGWIE